MICQADGISTWLGCNGCNGFPVTACDNSTGPNRGTLYVNWSDQRNGPNDTDIWLVKSRDGGLSWTRPRRVNDDPPGKQQFFTWMTIDQSYGTIYIVFYDRRNYADPETDVYLATSRDGGETFVNTRISESPFIPSTNWFIGDYINISACSGVVRPIWTRIDSHGLSLWTALINPSPKISYFALTNGQVRMSLTNLYSYLTNYVERSSDLADPASWTSVDTFTGIDGATNWTQAVNPSLTAAFYRVRIY